MQETASAAARRPRVAFVALVALAALAVAVVLVRGQNVSGASGGPLTINAGDTGVTFTTPADATRWKATTGGFLLCGDQPVTLRTVRPIRANRTQAFDASTRQFRIRSIPGGDRIAEPMLAGYGEPPMLGGVDSPPDMRLLGALQDADGARLELPPCEKTTNLPGEDAVELLVTATAGPAGAHVRGVRVAYEADGELYEEQIAIELILCGTASRSPDC